MYFYHDFTSKIFNCIVNTFSYQISIYLVNVQISFTFKWTRINVVTYARLQK